MRINCRRLAVSVACIPLSLALGVRGASAQTPAPAQEGTAAAPAPAPAPATQPAAATQPAPAAHPPHLELATADPGATLTGFVIGPADVLQIVFWREKDLSGEVVVRPDGRISLPLINEVVAAGLTPDALRAEIVKAASQFLGNPNVTVVVKEIRSRKAFITGSVERPGPYVLTGPTTVVQLIAMAGGLKDYADQKNIVVMRNVNGQQVGYTVDYHSLLRRQNLAQNLELMPGDTVLVR
jgi:polysaccharide export outer membrane protein